MREMQMLERIDVGSGLANRPTDFSDHGRDARLTMIVDLNAIEANYLKLQALAPRSLCGAVVKADAYGLGAVRIAPFLADVGCSHFFVTDLEEGIAVRDALPRSARVYLLHGVSQGRESVAEHFDLLPILNSGEQLNGWLQYCRLRNRVLPAGIHVDTGLSRLGFAIDELRAVADRRSELSAFPITLFMSHLACAEWRNEISLQQLRRFRKLTRLFPKAMLSLSNSSGIFAGQDYHLDLVRPGGGIFGLSTSDDPSFEPSQVVRLQTRIIQCRDVKRGEAIGYCRSFRARRRMRVATLSMGYADGLPRALGNRGHVFIRGFRAPIVGFVSMNLATIDVTGLPENWIRPGAAVDVICPEQTIGNLASASEMLGDELMTNIGRRCQKIYVPAPVSERGAIL